ncbi:uncharacterized protein IL334_001419 [Kwoniella shivajii]|uniref:Uncharacterized protein n=1 Tax=Kwoniella shivajii TaxID=564305 RepID=A0ABZ1CT09_9TREE|nr:hypothetical protein IL334_001419 [Kwoniella shivajii]
MSNLPDSTHYPDTEEGNTVDYEHCLGRYNDLVAIAHTHPHLTFPDDPLIDESKVQYNRPSIDMLNGMMEANRRFIARLNTKFKPPSYLSRLGFSVDTLVSELRDEDLVKDMVASAVTGSGMSQTEAQSTIDDVIQTVEGVRDNDKARMTTASIEEFEMVSELLEKSGKDNSLLNLIKSTYRFPTDKIKSFRTIIDVIPPPGRKDSEMDYSDVYNADLDKTLKGNCSKLRSGLISLQNFVPGTQYVGTPSSMNMQETISNIKQRATNRKAELNDVTEVLDQITSDNSIYHNLCESSKLARKLLKSQAFEDWHSYEKDASEKVVNEEQRTLTRWFLEDLENPSICTVKSYLSPQVKEGLEYLRGVNYQSRGAVQSIYTLMNKASKVYTDSLATHTEWSCI